MYKPRIIAKIPKQMVANAKIIAFREKSWFHERTEKALWNALSYGYEIPIQRISYWHEAEIPPESTIIGVDETGDVLLDEFEHPENAVYVFGRTLQALLHEINCDMSVRVKTKLPSTIFGVSIAPIVLEDRRRKLRGRQWQ